MTSCATVVAGKLQALALLHQRFASPALMILNNLLCQGDDETAAHFCTLLKTEQIAKHHAGY